jgi:hypothetical protein
MEIIAIGPNPPCIRCKTVVKRAQDVARKLENNNVEVKYILIPSPETERFGKIACGKEIEEVGHVEPDFDMMHRLLDQLDILEVDEDVNAAQIDVLLRELDEVLAPVRERAEELHYLMTPVLVVNGQVKSAGYVPSQEEIQQWVQAELGD